ncbi:hypothetical protein EMCG_08483 [[Emmonsia] crescens]|uniref:Uncharacterized protein n=1 Tax=[Emmonsia] crescens TaxID=73230 RepID=A0A0G2J4B4_9EURO|nr:hypothetical protein EMCG_08483 [Emmonsia crescens UAMH 3008]
MERILRTMPNPGGLLVLMCAPVQRAEGLWVHLPARVPNRSLELPPTPESAMGKSVDRRGGDACDTRIFESRFLPRQTLPRRGRVEATGATPATTVTSLTPATAAAATTTTTTTRRIRKVMMMTTSLGGRASGGNSGRGGPPGPLSLPQLAQEMPPRLL